MSEEIIDHNRRAIEREARLVFGIVRENRHSSQPPFGWYGPDVERMSAGPDCHCMWCWTLYGAHKWLVGTVEDGVWTHECVGYISVKLTDAHLRSLGTVLCPNCGLKRPREEKSSGG